MRRIIIEISLILLTSLLLSLIYSIVSPTGLIILKKTFKKNAAIEKSIYNDGVSIPYTKNEGR